MVVMSQAAWVGILAPYIGSCVTLGNLLHSSETRFLYSTSCITVMIERENAGEGQVPTKHQEMRKLRLRKGTGSIWGAGP